MKVSVVVFLLLLSGVLLAQDTKNPVSSVIKDMLPRQQKNITAAAEAMPAEKFSFKPTPEQMSFAHLVMHIAESNYLFCAKASDVPAPKVDELKETDGKDKLVAAVKSSFDFCTTALDKADDSKLGEVIDGFGGHKQTRAWAWILLGSSWADHYGAEAMYLRLNGILPPTAKK